MSDLINFRYTFVSVDGETLLSVGHGLASIKKLMNNVRTIALIHSRITLSRKNVENNYNLTVRSLEYNNRIKFDRKELQKITST